MRPNVKQTVRKIINAAAEVFSVNPNQITGRLRTAEAVEPRLAAYLIAFTTLPRISQQTIGNLIGNRGRSTVTHGIQAAKKRVETEPEFAMRVKKCRERIGV